MSRLDTKDDKYEFGPPSGSKTVALYMEALELSDDEDITLGEALVDVGLGDWVGDDDISKAKRNCEAGYHRHPPDKYDYCHPITRRHRDLGGSTGDSRIDEELGIHENTSVPGKWGDYTDGPSQGEMEAFKALSGEVLGRYEKDLRQYMSKTVELGWSIIEGLEDTDHNVANLIGDQIEEVRQAMQDNIEYYGRNRDNPSVSMTPLLMLNGGGEFPDTGLTDLISELLDPTEGTLFQRELMAIQAGFITDYLQSAIKHNVEHRNLQRKIRVLRNPLPISEYYKNIKEGRDALVGALTRLKYGPSANAHTKGLLRLLKNGSRLKHDDLLRLRNNSSPIHKTKPALKVMFENAEAIQTMEEVLDEANIPVERDIPLGRGSYRYVSFDSHDKAKEFAEGHDIRLVEHLTGTLPFDQVPLSILETALNGFAEMKQYSPEPRPMLAFMPSGGLAYVRNHVPIIHIEVNGEYWMRGSRTRASDSVQRGWWISGGITDTIRHEMGHIMQVRNLIGEELYEEYYETFLDFLEGRTALDGGESIVGIGDHFEPVVSPAWPGSSSTWTRRVSDVTGLDKWNRFSTDITVGLFSSLKERGVPGAEKLPDELDVFYKKISQKVSARIPNNQQHDFHGEISLYGVSDVGEFVAEVFTGLLSGRKYSKKIMDKYKRYKGYIPKEVL